MPARNDYGTEVEHLRRLLEEQRAENARLEERLTTTRQEAERTRAEVRRLQGEVQEERSARRVAERSLRIASEALEAQRRAQNVGAALSTSGRSH